MARRATSTPLGSVRTLALALAPIAAPASFACNTPGAQVRRAAERGDVAAALATYQAQVHARGGRDTEALAEVALVVLRGAAHSADPRERAAGFTALRSVGLRGREALEELAREDGVVGDRAAAAVYDLSGRAGAPPRRLFAAARSDDPERVVAGLAALEGAHDGAGLLAALGSVSPDVRRDAARRLARFVREPGATTALGDHALHDPDELVRMAAINALGEHGPAAAPALEQALHDPTEAVQLSALFSLSRAAPARAPDVLSPLLAHPPTPVGLEAARVLAQHGHREAEGYILTALDDPRPSVRAQAAVAAASLRESHAQDLAPHIEDADAEVQLRVAGILLRVPGYRDRIVRALRPVAQRPDPFVAVRALGVLAEAGDADAAGPLRGALASRDPQVRRLGVLAWSDLARESGDVDPLAPLLRDPDRTVRLMAAGEIVRLATP